ncbi:unnamed protein product [Penicillium nalgiovense]|uniref:Ketosynthase family 3 (KS3) domain-containing protein n=1 Tax=Penicillium nalgiovense TaxID=60175 RepID=A0A9W4IAD8_PENNA|nr:unnamed protein product [Penicillium nalgiovense]CAG7986210.1 unnamed protein product [Penicillium nalgiovense]CAG7986861.1 unnamed protein product [Penicillium nalgiovense]CAG7994296.1 unnamed protein product [Penicillium nalgiovense]CAG7994550.1 unnamed protein product [Penicillium nalgiovense]
MLSFSNDRPLIVDIKFMLATLSAVPLRTPVPRPEHIVVLRSNCPPGLAIWEDGLGSNRFSLRIRYFGDLKAKKEAIVSSVESPYVETWRRRFRRPSWEAARCRVPESHYNVDSYYSDTKKPGTVSTEYGYFLDESVDIGALDMSFFTMARSEVERADPQQRLMLKVTREAFEDAGVTHWRGQKTGTYIGNFGEDWLEMLGRETQPWGIHHISGAGDFVVANRLSYEYDLQGPSMTIRTACSSALVALNEACAAISRGDCESALVGGVNLILAPGMSMAIQEQGVLSSDGSCKTFSSEANGYARGEAVTAIFIKPLAHAIRDGNPIQAVVRSTSHNVDGKTPTLSQPSTDAQEALMRRAYEFGGITDFSKTAMVEWALHRSRP